MSSIENILTIKAVLRIFELVSGLKVNFSKSYLLGMNMDVFEVFLALIMGITRRDKVDSWVWKSDSTKEFSVSLTYGSLIHLAGVREDMPERVVRGFSRVWKSWTPSKVVVFS
ncbi:unnamed protein product [Vicia faba]|uniref:Uncharacterized protein n=1 Tax=Vicia faba TaxID=3906 RepID=A0AAV0YUW8_VICFA|nr:unnamed protein product [Vicia faba]